MEEREACWTERSIAKGRKEGSKVCDDHVVGRRGWIVSPDCLDMHGHALMAKLLRQHDIVAGLETFIQKRRQVVWNALDLGLICPVALRSNSKRHSPISLLHPGKKHYRTIESYNLHKRNIAASYTQSVYSLLAKESYTNILVIRTLQHRTWCLCLPGLHDKSTRQFYCSNYSTLQLIYLVKRKGSYLKRESWLS